jgi:hypothetical protein
VSSAKTDLGKKFVSTTHPQGFTEPVNVEPYGVWYATTEVYVETAQTLWVALGSDDHGALWGNGKRVWLSSPEHKKGGLRRRLSPCPFKLAAINCS